MAASHQRKHAAAVVLLGLLADIYPKKREKREPTTQWLRRREEGGAFARLVKEITVEDEKGYRNFLGLSRAQFQFVAEKSRPLIQRKPQARPLNLLNNGFSWRNDRHVSLRRLHAPKLTCAFY